MAIHMCPKQMTMVENSTEAKIAAAAFFGRILCWLVLFMSNLGLPFQGPIPTAKDNVATRIIAYSGKITCNVRHVTIKALALQGLVHNKIAVFNAIGTATNCSDHFTILLPYPAFREHIVFMMGVHFSTRLHAMLSEQRNHKETVANG